MQIESIPLTKLESSDANVRRVGRDKGIDGLAQSIEAHGLVSNLVVRKTRRGRFEVVAGHRRLAALTRLAEQGKLAADEPIACRVLEKDAIATEIGLAENEMRETMHIADAVTAYAALAQDGMSVDAIAHRFGQAATTVRRSLKLAALSPRVLDELRTGAMSVAQAQALAVSDDHGAQEVAWFEASSYQREPRMIRQRLTQEQESGASALAQFVGLEAYEAAGGRMVRDLFAEHDDDVLLLDRALLRRLAEAKLTEEAERVKAEGWRWAEGRIEAGDLYRMERLSHVETPLSAEDEAEEARLTEAYEQREATLVEQGGEMAVRNDDELHRIGDQLDALQAKRYGYDPTEMAHAGCVLTIDYTGDLAVHHGLVRADDRAALAALDRGQDGEEPLVSEGIASTTDTKAVGYSAALVEDLTAERTAALRVALANQPEIALAALLHPLVIQLFHRRTYGGAWVQSAIEIVGQRKTLAEDGEGAGTTKAHREWSAEIERWGYKVPGDPGDVWPWLTDQDSLTLHGLLAVCVAASLNAVEAKHDRSPTRLENADQIATALDAFDMAAWFEADEAFLKRLSKAQIVEAMTEAQVRQDAITAASNGKKAEAVAIAAREMKGSGWLPKPLRSAGDGDDGDALAAPVAQAVADDEAA